MILNKNDVQYIDIQRSIDGIAFEEIARLTFANEYFTSYKDEDMAIGQTHYYRLKFINLDGTIHYSSIRSASIMQIDFTISITPNPIQNGQIVVYFEEPTNDVLNWQLYNSFGQIVSQKRSTIAVEQQRITIDITDVSKGLYWLHISNATKQETLKIVY